MSKNIICYNIPDQSTFLSALKTEVTKIEYNLTDTVSTLESQLTIDSNETTIGIVWNKGYGDTIPVLSLKYSYDEMGLQIEEETTYEYYSDDLIQLINNVKSSTSQLTIDLITCNLNSTSFKEETSAVEQACGVKIRYSLDKTGNPNNGGDWILESHEKSIKDLYFTENISNYTHLLLAIKEIIIKYVPGTGTKTLDNFYLFENLYFPLPPSVPPSEITIECETLQITEPLILDTNTYFNITDDGQPEIEGYNLIIDGGDNEIITTDLTDISAVDPDPFVPPKSPNVNYNLYNTDISICDTNEEYSFRNIVSVASTGQPPQFIDLNSKVFNVNIQNQNSKGNLTIKNIVIQGTPYGHVIPSIYNLYDISYALNTRILDLPGINNTTTPTPTIFTSLVDGHGESQVCCLATIFYRARFLTGEYCNVGTFTFTNNEINVVSSAPAVKISYNNDTPTYNYPGTSPKCYIKVLGNQYYQDVVNDFYPDASLCLRNTNARAPDAFNTYYIKGFVLGPLTGLLINNRPRWLNNNTPGIYSITSFMYNAVNNNTTVIFKNNKIFTGVSRNSESMQNTNMIYNSFNVKNMNINNNEFILSDYGYEPFKHYYGAPTISFQYPIEKMNISDNLICQFVNTMLSDTGGNNGIRSYPGYSSTFLGYDFNGNYPLSTTIERNKIFIDGNEIISLISDINISNRTAKTIKNISIEDNNIVYSATSPSEKLYVNSGGIIFSLNRFTGTSNLISDINIKHNKIKINHTGMGLNTTGYDNIAVNKSFGGIFGLLDLSDNITEIDLSMNNIIIQDNIIDTTMGLTTNTIPAGFQYGSLIGSITYGAVLSNSSINAEGLVVEPDISTTWVSIGNTNQSALIDLYGQSTFRGTDNSGIDLWGASNITDITFEDVTNTGDLCGNYWIGQEYPPFSSNYVYRLKTMNNLPSTMVNENNYDISTVRIGNIVSGVDYDTNGEFSISRVITNDPTILNNVISDTNYSNIEKINVLSEMMTNNTSGLTNPISNVTFTKYRIPQNGPDGSLYIKNATGNSTLQTNGILVLRSLDDMNLITQTMDNKETEGDKIKRIYTFLKN